MSAKLQAALQVIGNRLDGIRRDVLKNDQRLRLTFICRDPSNPEADMLVSDDELPKLAELLIRSGKREPLGRTDRPVICGNCDTALPEGCGGLFVSDGAACKWKAPT